jgi:small subunit ribosomal protein S20
VANIKSAIKRHRQSIKRRVRNRSYRTQLRGKVKALRAALDVSKGKNDEILTLMKEAQASIAHVAAKGIIKAKTAARQISRLQKHVNAKIVG